MARVIRYIKKPLAEELLFGRLAQGGKVSVSVTEGELAFDFEGASTHTTEPLPAPVFSVRGRRFGLC